MLMLSVQGHKRKLQFRYLESLENQGGGRGEQHEAGDMGEDFLPHSSAPSGRELGHSSVSEWPKHWLYCVPELSVCSYSRFTTSYPAPSLEKRQKSQSLPN